MKRIISLFLFLVITISGLTGCKKDDPVTIRIAGLKGPTSMGLVQVMENAAGGKTANGQKTGGHVADGNDSLGPAEPTIP